MSHAVSHGTGEKTLAGLRTLLTALPSDWKSAADSIGARVIRVPHLYGADFAIHEELSVVLAEIRDDDCTWSAWGGIAFLVAQRNGIVPRFGDLCVLAHEQKRKELAFRPSTGSRGQ